MNTYLDFELVLIKKIVFTRLAGTALNVYIEKRDGDHEQRNCLSLITPSASKTATGTYRCVTEYKGVLYFQTHHIDIYGKI